MRQNFETTPASRSPFGIQTLKTKPWPLDSRHSNFGSEPLSNKTTTMSFPTNFCFICGKPPSSKLRSQLDQEQQSFYRLWSTSIAKSFCQLFYMGESGSYSDVVVQFKKCTNCDTLLRELDFNFKLLLSFQQKIGDLYNQILNLVDGNTKIQTHRQKWHPRVAQFYKILCENSSLPIDFNEYHTPIVRKFNNQILPIPKPNLNLPVRSTQNFPASAPISSKQLEDSNLNDYDKLPQSPAGDSDILEDVSSQSHDGDPYFIIESENDDIEVTFQGKTKEEKSSTTDSTASKPRSTSNSNKNRTKKKSLTPKTRGLAPTPRIRNPGDPLLCRPCSQVFNTSTEYAEHKKNCPTIFKCPFVECTTNHGQAYDPVGSLQIHFNTTHYQLNRLRCLECLKSWKIETEPEQFELLKTKLQDHYNLHKVNEEKGHKFKCVVDIDNGGCKEGFTTSINLKDHVVRVHEDPDVVSICQICDKVFATKISLYYHTKEYHSSKTPEIQCSDCEFRCNRPSDMKNHAKKHITERSFLCHACPKSYKTKRDLDRHYNVQHDPTSERKYKCSYANCEKAYYTSCTLKFHEESVHSNERSYICEFCSKTYKSKHGLDQHFRLVCKKDFRKPKQETHTAEESQPRPEPKFTCQSCKKPFKSQRSCRIHQKNCGQGNLQQFNRHRYRQRDTNQDSDETDPHEESSSSENANENKQLSLSTINPASLLAYGPNIFIPPNYSQPQQSGSSSFSGSSYQQNNWCNRRE